MRWIGDERNKAVDKFLCWNMMIVLDKVQVEVSNHITMFVFRNQGENIVEFFNKHSFLIWWSVYATDDKVFSVGFPRKVIQLHLDPKICILREVCKEGRFVN